ncbi:CooT family nickel-binding protein [Desulfuribacillus alkaliarsenatis]|uniref:DUF3842 domain-containing protein n=1 Tax=Desulfuribacillus alkaliarsenatis TaxID=766136 RepID=A0A1E5FZK7_9FIRM|nr:CooT family nickel-binding protein [Desulfuribacillus alkaliarsenatis]OEF96002.1 hypothetical protein BHF68_09650 [Desulfuribacillus alkaliarsenatis]
MVKIAIIDGQGGGIGKLITEKVRKTYGTDYHIIALGTNALAASLMLKAGANEAASGDNAVASVVNTVDIIIGSIGIVIPNSMSGEITVNIASSISLSKAHKFLLPLLKGDYTLIGNNLEPLPHLVDELLKELKPIIKKKMEEATMCEANAYLYKDGEETLLLERVDKIVPHSDGLYLENIFGEQKIIKAKIKKMELVNHKIILEKS